MNKKIPCSKKQSSKAKSCLYVAISIGFLGSLYLPLPVAAQEKGDSVVSSLVVGDDEAKANAEGADEEASNVVDWLKQGDFYGYVKADTYMHHVRGSLPSHRSHALGGIVRYQTPFFHGFRVGLGAAVSNTLGLNPSREHLYADMHVPIRNVESIDNAFVEYRGHGLNVKAGRMEINTPLANTAPIQSLIPLTYAGVAGTYQLPIKHDVRFSAYRMTRFKPWDSTKFGRHDTGTPVDPLSTVPVVDSPGFMALGANYDSHTGYKSQLWYYDFYKRFKVAAFSSQVPFTSLKFKSFTPFMRVAAGKQWNTSNQASIPLIDGSETRISHVDSKLYDLRLGVNSPKHTAYLFGTYVPNDDKAFRGGAFLSPYQYSGYNDNDFVSSRGINMALNTNARSGHGYGAQYAYHDKKWLALVKYVHLRFNATNDLVAFPRPKENGYVIMGMLQHNFTDRLSGALVVGEEREPGPKDVIGHIRFQWFWLTYQFGKKPQRTVDY